ncbi:hypothetical protein BJY16_008659 [Actinoplanes octamycinicus]|uniref:DUF1214 domain-containing protein n=1 Tax=Actinoplanes octamycinicus TaxID=135948 RepID=A0A7W7MCZ2_9ACTN|nr:hypothetical protein [Actinoplanes octamycinicus]MBB4745200.1 hypothetical protein [Actinoplanes octamycinicus]GIE62673.1 hypothetical protein Aoc01nite_80750 [Actinoplanes octamycinicus]
MVTESFADAIARAERAITEAPHVRGERDLIEGYDYLAGGIRASIQMAWAYDRDFPYFVRSTGPYTKMGLDNPDTLYFHAWLRDDAEYVVTGRRGSTADLSFQILDGSYSPVGVPGSLAAFDDREVELDADGSFAIRFGPGLTGRNAFPLAPGSAMLVVREVFSDWAREEPGTLRIHRADRFGCGPAPLTEETLTRRYAVAGKMLVGRIRTFLAFAERFYLNLPVNTLTPPRLTPGGLATQYSSAGHYALDDDHAMVVTVPVAGAPYQGLQLGSMWYVSLDYVNHQTSLTVPQAKVDPDGMIRYVISERDPGVANWIERTGHDRGYVQLRWQRLSRALTEADGPRVDLVAVDDLPKQLPYHEPIDPAGWRARIAARQAATAARMLG